MWPRVDGLRAFGLGTPGEMRNRLNASVFAGEKVATAGLWRIEYESGGEALDTVGERQVLLGSSDEPVAVVEIVRVELRAFGAVPWEFAESEGEGFTSVDDWRDGHRGYYGAQGTSVDDGDLVVCCWFRVVNRLDRQPG